MEVNTTTKLHFVLIPWLAQGHMIPMIDIARLLAARGITVSLITTPANLSRIKPAVDHISDSNLSIHFVPLHFPSAKFGLPEGCENLDSVPSPSLFNNFFDATKSLKQPLLLYLRNSDTPPASCIVFDIVHSWTVEVARKLDLPLVSFQGFGCFSTLCVENLIRYKTHEAVSSDSDSFVLPGLPQRIEITKPQLPNRFRRVELFQKVLEEVRHAELECDGIVVNSFDELEVGYSGLLEKATGKKVWMIGPVSMSNAGSKDLAQRGNRASIDEPKCLSWLDSQRPNSVVYVCFGSMGTFAPSQLMEQGMGLLASNQPFIWVIKSVPSEDVDKWLTENFTDESRCLVLRGWAPQLMILSHPSVGGFMTHCGWNSALEGISAGLPMATWPLFAEQFLNEKLLVEVLKIGVSVGVKQPTEWAGEVKDEIVVGRQDVTKAIISLMEEGEEGEGRRQRVREFKDMAKGALNEGGSSYLNLTMLIDFIGDFCRKDIMRKEGQ